MKWREANRGRYTLFAKRDGRSNPWLLVPTQVGRFEINLTVTKTAVSGLDSNSAISVSMGHSVVCVTVPRRRAFVVPL